MVQSFEEIKKAYPDEWLILGNPVMCDDGINIATAELLYHGQDKHELALRDKPLMSKYRRIAVRYNCATPHLKAMMIGMRTLSRTLYSGPHLPVKSKYRHEEI